MFNFSQQIVLIAGASGNLGQAVTHAFHAAGASLVLLDRAPDRLPQLFPDFHFSKSQTTRSEFFGHIGREHINF